MEPDDPLTLGVVYLDGFSAAQAGESRKRNPYKGSLAAAWSRGWDEGDLSRRRIGKATRKPWPVTVDVRKAWLLRRRSWGALALRGTPNFSTSDAS